MRWFLALLLAGAVGGGGYFWHRSSQPPPIPPERIVVPQIGTITSGVIAVGRCEPRTRIDIKSKANGIIRKLHVDVSDQVRAGQVIVELDREILDARRAEAEGKVQQAKGALESGRANLKRLEVEKTDPELVYARRNWERAQRLFEAQLISQDEVDLAKDRADKSEYNLRLIEAQIEAARAALTAAEGRVKEVEALGELARQEFLEATIMSPLDGVVLNRYLEEGDSVSSIRVAGGNATVIMSLGDLSELYVDGEVDEVDVGKIIDVQRIRPNLVARVTVESFKGRVFTGRVARIAPEAVEDQNGIRTFEVRILLENPEKLLLANMTANSQIVLREKKDVLLLSQGALNTERETRYVLVYDPDTGRTQRRDVVAGLSDGSQVEISSGLAPGQKVVIP